MKNSDLLKAAKALIADPKNWCKGVGSTTASGVRCFYNEPDAVRFCAVRAIERIAKTVDEFCAAMVLMQQAGCKRSANFVLYQYNNRLTTTHADMMSLFDEAIDNAITRTPTEESVCPPSPTV